MKFISTFVFLIIFSVTTFAQDSPKAELFGGYSYLRTDSEDVDLTQFGAPGVVARRGNANLNGWNLAITGNPVSWAGFVADFGGTYGRVNYSATGLGTVRIGTRYHSFLFGPQFYFRGGKVTGFVRGMIGAVRADYSANLLGQSFDEDETAFAAAFGGGVDVKFAEKVSLRLFQADLILTRFDGAGIANDTQKAVRVSTGFVFRN